MYSILIIEDDQSYRSMIETILQMEGFSVRSTSRGAAALDMISETRPDLILCDIMMPEMDGHCVLDAVRGSNSYADIPFIFVTALGERSEMRRGMSAGADDYLSKPFSAVELIAAVTSRIRRIESLNQQHGSLISDKELQLFQKITKREKEVLLMVAQGSTSREIAEHLGVSVKTIEVHRANLMDKLKASNAASLARWAIIAQQVT